MKLRFPLILIVFQTLHTSLVLGQESSFFPPDFENLNLLLEIPLEGEKGPPSQGPRSSDLDGLAGRTITLVTAVDPPPGFTPVSDADIPLGTVFNAAVVRRAIGRLWETGNYSDIKVYAQKAPGNGVEVLLSCRPMFRIRKLEVEGNDALAREAVEKAIDYTPDRTIRPSPEVLRKLRHKLLDTYTKRGYPEASASLRLETTSDPGGVALIVDITEGKPERYTRIRTSRLPDELRDERLTESVGLKSGIVRHKESVEESIQALSEKLASLGYRDAKVGPFRERLIKRHEIELLINIEANIKTEIEIRGNRRFRKKDLTQVFIGETLVNTTPESLEFSLASLKRHYRKHGYFHAQVAFERYCHSKNGNVYLALPHHSCKGGDPKQTILIEVAEGPAVTVDRIVFSGNTYFSDSYLEDEVFAFIKEQNQNESLFQPFSTANLDDLGVSDKRPKGMERGEGIAAPNLRFSRTYTPSLYQKTMVHLEELYQEKGFLGVHIGDSCDITSRQPIKVGSSKYRPFLIKRDDDKESSTTASAKDLPCVFISEDLEKLVVYVEVKENAQTKLSEMRFEGNHVFDAKSLVEVSGLAIGDPYNEFQIREAAREIASFYKSQGYMFTDVAWDNSFSTDMERARVRFTADEGPQTKVGKIRIEGAKITSKKLLFERLTLESGDLITPKEIEESQQRLMELGILDSATIQIVSPEEPAPIKNLLVTITEGKPQYLELKAGIATVEGLRGGFEYGYRNLGGWALSARLRLRANYRLFFLGSENPVISQFQTYYDELSLIDQMERHILLGIGQIHLPGTKGHLGWALDAIDQRLNEPAYSAERDTAYIRMTTAHPIRTKYRRAIVAELKTGLELNRIEVLSLQSLDDSSQPIMGIQIPKELSRMPQGQSLMWVTGLKATLDLRDHPFNPNRGIFISAGADYVHSLGDDSPKIETLSGGEERIVYRSSRLIRASATFSSYIPFGSSEVVLALSFSAGYIFHLRKNSTTWADRYFYVGGVETLRGFPEESLVPEDIYQTWKTTLRESSDDTNALLRSSGGEMMLISRIEIRYPLGSGFLGALFGEAGNLWRDTNNLDILDINPFAIHLRPVAGGGIRYLTPLGPIAFDLGINLFKRPHEERLAWFFSLGSAF